VLLLIVLLMPFDLTVRSAELAEKYREGKVWLVPFHRYFAAGEIGLIVKLAANVACFFPVGFLRALATEREAATRNSWLRPLLLGLGITALVEFLQLLAYSRVCDTTDILTGTVAVMLGWRAGEAVRDAPRSTSAWSNLAPLTDIEHRWRRRAIVAALALAWLGGTIYLYWSPFDFTTDPAKFPDGPDDFAVWGLRRMSMLPFVDYYWGSKYQALDQFLKKTVSFLPLGILCALASRRVYSPWGTATVLLVALPVALALGTGRYFLPSHTASVTDVLLQCGGAWLGFKLTQYVRALLWAERTLFGYASQ
jgi:glycopeptide antibiotics resistance protein